MNNSQNASLAAALEGLWARFVPQLEERITLLESANRALGDGRLTPQGREEAHSAAHKLAGSLGTFGLSEGTELAREAEKLYAPESELDPAAASRLIEIAATLRTMIAQRK